MLSKSNVPTTNFTTPGFKISLSGTSQASQTHSGGSRHLLESVIYNYLLYRSQRPLIGIRELREDYSRISDIGSYPFGKRQSSIQEQSHTYSQQAGLSFYFKIFESLRFKATGKLFQAINGKLQLVRNDTQQVASDYYITNFQSKTNHVKSRGNEIEGEFSYSLKKINFFLGYNLTTTYREANRDSNFIPTIVTNGNLQTEYIRFFYSEFLSERNLSANDGASYKPRVQILKHFYFGVSINF